ncbi:MAG TPA: flippase-like domain-containing protein [Thermoleophilia bacterium]|nr:flippase-like domain-containing protein [Thermoleophilia bacterium]
MRAAIVFLVIVVALFLILPRLAGQKHALALLREASLPLLLAAVVVEAASLVFYSLLFRRLLGLLRYPVGLALALRINLAGLAAAHLFSAGGVGGAALTYRVLQKRGMPHSIVLIAVIFQNAFAYSVLFLLFGIGLAILVIRGQANDFALAFASTLVVLLLALAAYGFWLLNHPSSLRRRARQIVDLLGRRIHRLRVPHARLDEWLDGVVEGWRRLRKDGRRHVRTVGQASGYWAFDIACLALVLLAFGQHLSVDALLIAYPVGNVVGAFSPTPGGLGAVEGVLIGLLVGFGLAPGAAVAVVLVYRLINFWLPIPVGLLTYLSLR